MQDVAATKFAQACLTMPENQFPSLFLKLDEGLDIT